MPHVMGAAGNIVAILWATPNALRAPAPPDRANKILWVSRVSSGPMTIRATLAGSMRTATVDLPNGPGPSYVDMPAPGCWTLHLSWGGHTDQLSLRYVGLECSRGGMCAARWRRGGASEGVPVTARLTRRSGGPARLRALLDSGQTIVAPGAFDPLSARLVEEAGFPAVYMTGFGTSAALIGRPDVGLLTMTEMAGNAGRIAACVDVPVIADADTGYGNPLNVIRTVGAYEAAGVAGIHIEDQLAPKKCGHLEGKLLIPAEEMAEKVRAAVEARTQPEFVIIARTDARAVEGLERSLQRGRMYREAGADVLFIEALTSEAEAEEAVKAFPGVPLLFNWAEGGKTPPISLDRVKELGYRIVIFPISTLLAATGAMRQILQEIVRAGTPAAAMHELPTFAEFVDFIGLPEVREAEQRYTVR
jgi:2-methylisocitrate lyase-like PEP mutase family enzyme